MAPKQCSYCGKLFEDEVSKTCPNCDEEGDPMETKDFIKELYLGNQGE